MMMFNIKLSININVTNLQTVIVAYYLGKIIMLGSGYPFPPLG